MSVSDVMDRIANVTKINVSVPQDAALRNAAAVSSPTIILVCF